MVATGPAPGSFGGAVQPSTPSSPPPVPALPPTPAPPAPPDPGAGPIDPVTGMTSKDFDAFKLIDSTMTSYGLGTFSQKIKDWVIKGYSPDTINLLLQDTPEFQARFPAIKHWEAAGNNVAQYVSYENNARDTERLLSLPKGFITDPHRIAELINNNVSANEVTSRGNLALASSYNANPETKSALQRLYGLDQGALAAYYLDPDHGLPYIQKMSAAAAIAGAASQSAFTIDKATAEEATTNGMTAQQAQQSFQNAAGLEGLTTQGDLTQSDLIGAALGKTASQAAVTGKTAQRKANSAGGGSATSDQSGFSGLGASSS